MATDWLKKLRTENFPSQTALALAAGIKPARYSRIEKGYSDMRDEEIDGLAKALKLTADEVRSGQPGSSKPKVAEPNAPSGVRAAGLAAAAQSPQPIVTAPALPSSKVPAAETAPGDNLDDPKNFSLMPPLELLAVRGLDDSGVRAQLQKAASYAEKVLHTSKVRPAVWVAWRDFSREAQKLLRGAAPAAAVEPKPIEKPQFAAMKPVPVRPAPPKESPKAAAPRLHGNKNIFGHFVDVARESLPEATRVALNEKALAAKTTNPEMGFMKHFRRIAELELPREEFDRIDREATRRDGSGV